MSCVFQFFVSVIGLLCYVHFEVVFHADGQPTEDANGSIETDNIYCSRLTGRKTIESMMQTLKKMSDGLELVRQVINTHDSRLSLLEEKPQSGIDDVKRTK